jgi:uncharacterized membrane protein (UPF0127 family)
MKINFNYKNKKFSLEVKKCNLFEAIRGLMFRRRESAPALLLFDFKKPKKMKIHSCFVFFPFVALWLDDKNNVIEIRTVKPWKFYVLPEKKFRRLIEIPVNKKYSKLLDFSSVIRKV